MHDMGSKVSKALFSLLIIKILQVCGDPNLRKVGAALAC